MSDVEAQEAAARRDFRTPVGRARGLGSAKSGTGHFWWQRVTAIVLALLVPWLIGTLVSLVGADLIAVITTLAKPHNAILFAVFAVALFWHAKLGIQVVIEDYVHTRGLEVALQMLVTIACALGALACLYALGHVAMTAAAIAH